MWEGGRAGGTRVRQDGPLTLEGGSSLVALRAHVADGTLLAGRAGGAHGGVVGACNNTARGGVFYLIWFHCS